MLADPRVVAEQANLFAKGCKASTSEEVSAREARDRRKKGKWIKKRTPCGILLAPVEGLGPPTLRLTAECSTD